MQKVYKIKNLDCAHCAGKIEDGINKIAGVSRAQIDFINQKLTLSADEAVFPEILEETRRLIHALEPDVTITEEHTHEEENHRGTLLRIIVAALLFTVILFLPEFCVPAFLLYLVPYLIVGGDILYRAVKNIFRGQVFDENFLMALATVGAFAIGEYPEAVAVMLFYQVGELFQSYAVGRSRKSIAKLLNIRPETATVIRDGVEIEVTPEEIAVGEVILVRPGEKIPLDGVVLEGNSSLDTSALTGESLPRSVEINDEVLGGCVNQNGLLKIQVKKPYAESTVAKILELVETAGSKKAKTENFITRFARYYTPVVVILAVLLAAVMPILTNSPFTLWLNRSLIFLVVSCPCALVISVPLSFFGGIGGASRQGILIKGSNFLEALSKAETLVFDKTGTLTEGVFRVTDYSPAAEKERLLELAALAESGSNHPIARSVLEAYGKEIDRGRLGDVQELAGMGVKAVIDEKTVLVGNRKLMETFGLTCMEDTDTGTVVHVASDGIYLGSLLITDSIKPEAPKAIADLKDLGITKTVILTGDTKEAAKAVAETLKIDKFVAGLLPDEKLTLAEEMMNQNGKGTLVFIGDGMNDAPVLSRVDVGIAMGAMGQDAAIEASDIVLMDDSPAKLPMAVTIARRTMAIVRQNIVFALSVKAIVLLLGALGFANMWIAVFADVGVSVLAVLNAMRALSVHEKSMTVKLEK
ncbi:MAG: cadmium-translocating P-type ATPase [Clostridia bacterium]|nr:cadmium-translocating P-type ATPase [Clostridia bacterium]